MRISLLPVFDESDLAAVPNALEFFKRNGLESLMVLHNPSIGLKGAVTDQYDNRIKELRAEVKKAVDREDFDAAKEYKLHIENAMTDKDLAIREGWSKVPQPEREAVYRRIFGSIGTDAVICLNENLRHEQIFQALNGLLEVWPKDIPHGEFSVVWPRSVPEQMPLEKTVLNAVQDPNEKAIQCAYSYTKKRTAKKPSDSIPETPEELRASLRKSRYGGVKSACKRLGIDTTGKDFDALIEEVIGATFGAAA
jgi:hypothetical protein